MKERFRIGVGSLLAAVLLAPVGADAQSTPCGPVLLAGHDADDHGFEDVYAGLFDSILNNVQNGGTGILSLGTDPFSESGTWITNVASLMAVPQPVTFVNDADLGTASFAGYAILFVPSDEDDVDGGISLSENGLLAGRALDVAAFVNAGGGLFGLTQGTFANGWAYVSAVATIEHLDVDPSGRLPSGHQFDDVSATAEGMSLGITDTNLDGCCFHNVFTVHPAFLEPLAVASEPLDPDYHGQAVFIGGLSTCLAPFCGDGVVDPGEQCDDGNSTDGDGCSSQCLTEAATNLPPVIACLPCETCTEPGACSVAGNCGSLAVCIDPEKDVVTQTCAPSGPYGLGSTAVSVTCSDGVHTVTAACALSVRDCEPPACLAPSPLLLECASPCGAAASDPAVVAWLASATGSDNCSAVSPAPLLGSSFPSACGAGAATPVGFTVVDAAGYTGACAGQVIVRDTLPPSVVPPPPLLLECQGPNGVPVSDPAIQAWLAQARGSDLCSAVTIGHDAPAVFGQGCGAAGTTTTVTFTATDGCGLVASATSTVTVRDTTPPVVADCGLNDLCLWPPNHKYVCFDGFRARIAVTDACDDGARVAAIECSSDQCDDAPCAEHPGENGDGHTVNDCYYDELADRLCVRAERAGTNPEGRTYSVAYAVEDACGNRQQAVALRLRVPHDQSPHEGCISAPPGASE